MTSNGQREIARREWPDRAGLPKPEAFCLSTTPDLDDSRGPLLATG
jgi:hypothetical protein